jgi:hypothetical protein
MKLDAGDNVNWFNSEVSRRVGNGDNTSFWEVAWKGDVPLHIKYPRLFSLSNQQEARVAELWVVNATGSQWMFSWRRPFFVWEEAMYADLLEDLAGFVGSQDRDKWRWRLEEDRVFMVKSLYSKLVGRWLGEGFFAESQLRMFTHIWKGPAPAKVMAFSWKLLRDRIPL